MDGNDMEMAGKRWETSAESSCCMTRTWIVIFFEHGQDMTFDAEVKTLLAELLASKLELWNLSCSALSSHFSSHIVAHTVMAIVQWNEFMSSPGAG